MIGTENYSPKGCTDKMKRFPRSKFSQIAGSNLKNFALLSSIQFQSVHRQRRFITVLYSSMAATVELNFACSNAALNISDTAHVRLRHKVNEAVICKTVNPSTLLSTNVYLLPFWAPFRPSVHTNTLSAFTENASI